MICDYLSGKLLALPISREFCNGGSLSVIADLIAEFIAVQLVADSGYMKYII